MRNRCIQRFCLLAALAGLSSCAYMQSHKNIIEAGRQHKGYHLESPLKLYRAGGQYYLAAEQQDMQIHYPTIHDSIFLKGENSPTLSPRGTQSETIYFPLAAGTGEVMQRQDGFVELDTLRSELEASRSLCTSQLPAGAVECTIRADVQGSSVTWLNPAESTPAGTGHVLLGTLDRVLIDWPGTVLYNISIPVMAPFVFFHQFLNEE